MTEVPKEDDFDFDKLLDGACERADTLFTNTSRGKGFFDSLDCHLSKDDLYLTAVPSSGSDGSGAKVVSKVNEAFNTGAQSGRNHLTVMSEKAGANIAGIENKGAAKPVKNLAETNGEFKRNKRKMNEEELNK